MVTKKVQNKEIINFILAVFRNAQDNAVESYLKALAEQTKQHQDKILELQRMLSEKSREIERLKLELQKMLSEKSREIERLKEETRGLMNKIQYLTQIYYSGTNSMSKTYTIKPQIRGIKCVNCKGKGVFTEGPFEGKTCIACNGSGIT